MRIFLDFEASSLSRDGYPIEIGWVDEHGEGESHLIRPAPGWTDWDASAEAVHGLGRDLLDRLGEPHDQVAHRTLAALEGHDLYASAPSWDGMWMSLLLRSAGLPRHALRLRDTDEAFLGMARDILGGLGAAEVEERALDVVFRAKRSAMTERPSHRALADARQEREIWLQVRRLAEAEARLGKA